MKVNLKLQLPRVSEMTADDRIEQQLVGSIAAAGPSAERRYIVGDQAS
jgi:hypothetical protein